MRRFSLVMLALIASVSAAMAQSDPQNGAQDKTQDNAHKSVALPQITIGGSQQGQGAPGNGQTPGGAARCGNAQPGANPDFACLNQQLQNQVNGVNPSIPAPPIDAKSSDIKVGTVNIPAVKQQYGQNFGVSVIPYRPALTFRAPAMGGRH